MEDLPHYPKRHLGHQSRRIPTRNLTQSKYQHKNGLACSQRGQSQICQRIRLSNLEPLAKVQPQEQAMRAMENTDSAAAKQAVVVAAGREPDQQARHGVVLAKEVNQAARSWTLMIF
jgi:hypothetical protein